MVFALFSINVESFCLLNENRAPESSIKFTTPRHPNFAKTLAEATTKGVVFS